MDEITFKSITDLYKRLLPALNDRKFELKRINIITSEKEIWQYLKDNIWTSSIDLSLDKMVSDIFNFEIEKFLEHRSNNG